MDNDINALINLNLKLIFESRDQCLLKYSLVDKDGNRNNDSGNLSRILEQEGLIEIIKNNCCLSKFGREVSDNGGWLKYLENEKADSQKLKEKSELKEQLELDLKLLQIDNFEHLKTIRDQKTRILNLEEQIKLISLIKLYWWFIPTCITVGVFLSQVWDLIMS